MSLDVRVLEKVARVAPAGIMFWDEVREASVGDALDVVAYRPVNAETRFTAYPNPSGIYVFRSLPWLGEIEYGAGDEPYWTNLPFQLAFVVEATDRAGRFQPVRFTADLPNRFVFRWPCAALGTAIPPLGAVPLYSAPTRLVSAGMAALRARMWDSSNNKPAAWAVLDASFAGKRIGRGVAGEDGNVLVIFAYPPPVNPIPVGGLPPPPATSMWQQTWRLQLQARYAPAGAGGGIPDWCTALSQAEADMWVDLPNGQLLTEAVLSFGRELVLKSQGSKESQLFIT